MAVPYIPKYLKGQTPPAEAVRAVQCPECGRTMHQTPSGYLACEVLSHGSLKSPLAITAVICAAWPLLDRSIRPATVIRRLLSVLPPIPPPLVNAEVCDEADD